MKSPNFSLLPFLLIATLGMSPVTIATAVADDDSSEVHKLLWPRTYQDDTTTVLIYQPDIENGTAMSSRPGPPFRCRTRAMTLRPSA